MLWHVYFKLVWNDEIYYGRSEVKTFQAGNILQCQEDASWLFLATAGGAELNGIVHLTVLRVERARRHEVAA